MSVSNIPQLESDSRDGPAHRGGLGTDWKNTSWEEDGVVRLEEWRYGSPSPLPDQKLYILDWRGL